MQSNLLHLYLFPMKKIRIYKGVYEGILNSFKNAPIESGGIIAAADNGVICDFRFQIGNNGKEFVIDPEIFNPVISEWFLSGKKFAGIIHSHPNGLRILSDCDIGYARKVLEVNPFMRYIVMGVVTVEGEVVRVHFYGVGKNSRAEIITEII